MNLNEQYEFDRVGYLVIRNMLTRDDVALLSAAIDEMEAHALENINRPPRKKHVWGGESHQSERGYFAHGSKATGSTLILEDFWNYSPAFDGLIGHAKTMTYINQIVQERPTINNSEIRIRYPGNATGVHMGGPISHKYRYAFTNGRSDCMMVRMIYFVHDVGPDNGPFCVVPATHKSNLNAPYKMSPDEEPGMIGLHANAGDAILFTENLRHGGFTNRSALARKTLHVGYGPHWMMSQNVATMDEAPYITEDTRARLSREQRAMFEAWDRTPAKELVASS